MDEYILFFRLDLLTKDAQPSPEQLEVYMRYYHEWVEGIIKEGKFVGGKGLSTEGRVLTTGGVITDGPFAEIKESVAGYILVRAEDFEDATRLAQGCPILGGKGNSVEVRKIQRVNGT